MWRERADYGHFFYRIPNGESAADAYDRVSGFNESLWRSFSEPDFPSVCVLVTHGLMTRVFLMKWYHWSVEYFEDLRNVGHCEMILMEKNMENQKFMMKSQLRTWSELKRQKAAEAAEREAQRSPMPDPQRRNTLSQFLPKEKKGAASPPPKRWGGCVDGCDHHHEHYPRRSQKEPPALNLPPAAASDKEAKAKTESTNGVPVSEQDFAVPQSNDTHPSQATLSKPADGPLSFKLPYRDARHLNDFLTPGRDGGGTESGAATPHDGLSDDSDYFEPPHQGPLKPRGTAHAGSLAKALRKAPKRKTTEEDIERWATESGMGAGKRADALGDDPQDGMDEEEEQLADEAGDGWDGSGAAVKEQLRSLKEERTQDQSVRGSVY